MKIVFIGTVQFSKCALEKLISLKADIVSVLTAKDTGSHSDYADLEPVCAAYGIECRRINDINAEEVKAYLMRKVPDYIFCFGWSQLLDKELLKIPASGVIGFHPALLPNNRGRHPIVWALALGLVKTGSTFFFMDEGADSGDMLSQREIPIAYSDDARSLYAKMNETALEQIEDFLPRLESGKFERIRQQEESATFLRKRNKGDGEIDWKKPSREIYNLIRALTYPYVGAHFTYEGRGIKVWGAKEIKSGEYKGAECGKIVRFNNDGSFVVKTGEDAICVLMYEPRNVELKEGKLLR